MIYHVTLHGRASTCAAGESARGSIQIEAWDRGDARRQAERHIVRTGALVLGDVRCDEVEIVDVRKVAAKAGRR